MSCSIRNSDLLLEYCAGKLDVESTLKLKSHITGCAECAAFEKAQSAVWNAMGAWETVPVSADFNRRLYARIEAAEAAPWYQRLTETLREFVHPMFARPAFPLAAACLVVAGGFLMDHSGGLSPVTSRASVHVSAVEAEQVESTLDDVEMLRQFDPSADDKENSSKSM